MNNRILVIGDVVADHYLYEAQRALPGSGVRTGAKSRRMEGGAALLHRVLTEATRAPQPGLPPVLVNAGFPEKSEGAGSLNSYIVMQPCALANRKSDVKVWRLTQPLGVEDAGDVRIGDAGNGVELGSDESASIPALAAPHQIVVIDDANLGFRRWSSRSRWPLFLRPTTSRDVIPEQLPEWIVLKSTGPLAAGNLWHVLASGQTQHKPEDDQPRHVSIGELAPRTIVVVSVEDLRLEGIRVDGQLSWEGAAQGLMEDLRRHPQLTDLRRTRFLVVRFALDGVLVVDWSKSAEAQATLIFDPSGVEGSFAKQYPPHGRTLGYHTAFTAAIVARLIDVARAAPTAETQAAVVQGAIAGLSAARCLLHEGHGEVGKSDPGFPFEKITAEISGPTGKFGEFGTIEVPKKVKGVNWSIVAGSSSKPLWGLARRVALNGLGELTSTPYLQFGKLFSIDRLEMESLRTLQRLLSNYRRDLKATKPLSIAAFGPPGAGKSFGVKQLANALFDDPQLLEFNLSQFRDESALQGLFHQIRDAVLEGKLPVVFWDEFDSRNLNWLQYLLAPMQDGTFQEGQITHPIGKCVFVFAGGTRHRFEDFGQPPETMTNDEQRQAWLDDFILKKGPDFKSRLAGYINVLGPNRNKFMGDDLSYPVRRALLLRVHLGLKPHEPMRMDHGLLHAFLRIGEYKHGARSLEKIAEQVRLSSRHGVFTRSDVPSAQQLALHVDAQAFLDILESA